MALTPLPTQTADAVFLVRRQKACLFSEPGTGKTITALEAWRAVGGRAVIICPPIALRMWQRTIEDQLGKTAQIMATGKTALDPDADAYITTYSLVERLRAKLGDDFDLNVLILDEADALKTLSSARTTAVFGRAALMKDCLAAGVPNVWFLTGTPIRRYADDLYPVLKALFRDVLAAHGLASLVTFRDRFCVTSLRRFHPRSPAEWVVIGNKNEDELRRLIYDNEIAVRRTIHDVAAFMPPLTVSPVSVDFVSSPELDMATGEAEGADETSAVMATARRLLGVAKAPFVADYVVETWESLTCPVLILYWHKEVGDILHKRLADSKHELQIRRIDGSSSQADRTAAEAAFNAQECDILLGQIASMGVAINLQEGGHYAIFAERDWSPASEEQALRRLWRLGQKLHVHVDICEAMHPIDGAVEKVVARKKKSASKITD